MRLYRLQVVEGCSTAAEDYRGARPSSEEQAQTISPMGVERGRVVRPPSDTGEGYEACAIGRFFN